MKKSCIKSNSPIQLILILSYFAVTLSMVGAVILGIFQKNSEMILYAVATIVVTALLPLLRKYAKLILPISLELYCIIFLFFSITLAKLFDFYTLIPCWDIILHTASGPLLTAIGVALLGLWQFGGKRNEVLTPLFVVLFGIFFSMTIAGVWEFYEFASDLFFATEMQKHEIVSGVLDTGLFDTMSDMLTAFAGSILYGICLFFYIKRSKSLESLIISTTSK